LCVVVSAAPQIALEAIAMGWRDINMNRRKPRPSFAVVPLEGDGDARSAVLRKAARAAVSSCASQWPARDTMAGAPQGLAFAAGYIAGFARHQGLKHGVDAEQHMAGFASILLAEAPEDLRAALAALAFSPRAILSARAMLAAADGAADAGYLTGHLESLCGSRRLLGLAAEIWSEPGAAGLYLTACDTAADRMQTHLPTASLRFDEAERAVISAAFSPSAG
jgi:hypothetical protein